MSFLQKEKDLLKRMQSLGMTISSAIDFLIDLDSSIVPLLDYEALDTRDVIEGGKVVQWLNNIEKDTQYKHWPKNLKEVRMTLIRF